MAMMVSTTYFIACHSTSILNAVGDVLKLGQRVNVKVIDIDHARHRISLSLIHNS